jgi:REP element-mobilizing transposase RayT
LTFQVVGWADVFSRKVCRDFILENLTYSRNEKGLYLYGYVIMSNHIHLVVQQKDGKLSEWVRDFKKFTSKKLLKLILHILQESRGECLKMIFEYHAKYNKRSGDLQFWTHEIEHDPNCHMKTNIDQARFSRKKIGTGYMAIKKQIITI